MYTQQQETNSATRNNLTNTLNNIFQNTESNEVFNGNSENKSVIGHFLNMAPDNGQEPLRTVISGPTNSGKTSLLFDIAYHAAKANDSDTVVMILHSSKHSSMNFPVKCVPKLKNIDIIEEENLDDEWDMDVLHRLHIKYFSSIAEIVGYLSLLQILPMSDQPRGGLLIDDLHLFLNTNTRDTGVRMMQLLQVTTFLGSSIEWLESANTADCCVVKPSIAVAFDDSVFQISGSIRNLFTRWFSTIAYISSSSRQSNNKHVWQMRLNSLRTGDEIMTSSPRNSSKSKIEYQFEKTLKRQTKLSWLQH